MSALLCGVGPGDEVVMPSYTFVSTANAFALRGASIRFVDIRPDTLNIDETKIEAAITNRTKAIVPVHYAGVGAAMDIINDIASRHRLKVIEDAAQGVDGTYRGRYLGTLGDIGAYSFHETKNVIAGEGGALVLNHENLVEQAEIIRDKGTNRSNFFRGLVDKYTWVSLGSSYLASELTAAFLYGQLEAIESITRKRLAIFDYYRQGLEALEARGDLQLPACPIECRHNAHMFYVVLPTARQRDELMRHLHAANIHAVIHFVPLHSSPMGRVVSAEKDTYLPVTEDISARLLRLPCYFELEPSDQDRVIDAVWNYLSR
jgi:dTDP-4-amino-4,6-dideoxygalactose transaminase